jgi:hypothetical protein
MARIEGQPYRCHTDTVVGFRFRKIIYPTARQPRDRHRNIQPA